MFQRKKQDKLSDMLNRHDRGVGRRSGVTSVLSNLFRSMIWDLGVTPQVWRMNMDRYVASEVEKQKQQSTSGEIGRNNKRDRTYIRGNLNKEFMRTRMTWKVFCKAMAFLQLRSFRVVIMAMHQDGRITEHSCLVDYSTVTNPLSDDDYLKFLKLRPSPQVEMGSTTEPAHFEAYNPVHEEQENCIEQTQEPQPQQLDLFDEKEMPEDWVTGTF